VRGLLPPSNCAALSGKSIRNDTESVSLLCLCFEVFFVFVFFVFVFFVFVFFVFVFFVFVFFVFVFLCFSF